MPLFHVSILPSHLDCEPFRAESMPLLLLLPTVPGIVLGPAAAPDRCVVDKEAKSNILLMEVFYIFPA